MFTVETIEFKSVVKVDDHGHFTGVTAAGNEMELCSEHEVVDYDENEDPIYDNVYSLIILMPKSEAGQKHLEACRIEAKQLAELYVGETLFS